MHLTYVIVLPLWLVSATPVKEGSNNVEVRGANNGCPVAHGGCDGCSGVPNADCVAYGDADAQTFCLVKE
ncbi:hypothetical protein CFE70_010163 [Pyrenophora teres f. teres 0-1]